MIGKRNLGKAVVLGLLLSTGVYGAVWAKESGSIYEPNLNEYYENENLEITSNSVALGYNGTVEIKNGDLIIHNETNSEANGIESSNHEDALVTVTADNIEIHSGANGLAALPENTNKTSSSITLNINEDLTIEAGGQGIDNRNNAEF